jgi:hypothetical protein
MILIAHWLIVLATHAEEVRGPTDCLAPSGWTGNPWGPEATRARAEARLPSIVLTPTMERWDRWGRTVLRDGDVLFRVDDARTLAGLFPFSRFLASASGSRYAHAAIVAVEDGEPVVYDCSRVGVRRQPFAVWTLDNVGPVAVKRLKAEHRRAIPGVLSYCRTVFEEQVPFDFSFDLDDSALYCVEMTEKAFRSQGLALSEPVQLGDMENATRYPICMAMFVWISPMVLKKPLALEQRVYLPGNARYGMWASPLLEEVYTPPADRSVEEMRRPDRRLSFVGDCAIVAGIVNELRTSARPRSEQETRLGVGPRGSERAAVAASTAAK